MKARWLLTMLAVLCILDSPTRAAQLQNDPTHETTTPDVPGLTAATSLCKPSAEDTYGTSMANAVKVGGGAMYAGAREIRFLSALRGPAGEGVHFKRNGSGRGPDGTILDIYRVEIRGGLSTTIYIDAYHWVDPLSPAGFLCGAAMNLAPPGPDAFETTTQQWTIAVALGAHDVEPISLDADGSKRHGVAYDHVRLIALAARAAAEKGQPPLNPAMLPREVGQARLIVIASPLKCDDEVIAPESIVLSDSRGNSPPSPAKASGDKIADLSPGLPAMPGAIAVAYGVPALIQGAKTTVRYAKACQGQQDVVMPISITPPRPVTTAPAPAPAGKTVPADGARVVLQLFVADDGSAAYPAFVSGPFEFTDAAIQSLKSWRFEPSRVNGAQLYQAEKVMVVVK